MWGDTEHVLLLLIFAALVLGVLGWAAWRGGRVGKAGCLWYNRSTE